MNKRQVERFFKILSELYPKECEIILTGAAAGALYGRVRATLDVDFSAQAKDWQKFVIAVNKASNQTGILAQYGEDIDRWSSITLMDYRKHTYLYRRFGAVELRLMEPPYWAIGKLSRYLDSDIQDMKLVFRKTKTAWQDVARVAGKSLTQSPKSTACFLFRKQVEHFLKTRGRAVWGRSFRVDQAIARFHRFAGIRV